MDKQAFAKLKGQNVERLFLIVWPPHWEEAMCDVDISLGLVLSQAPHRLCVLTTDKDQWTPLLREEALPRYIFTEQEFEPRLKSWMAGNEGLWDYEYYDFTNNQYFCEMVSHPIQEVELLSIEGSEEYFGVRLVFTGDYILSLPICDGNTIETLQFNRMQAIATFEKMGMVTFSQVEDESVEL